jgi:hypothetical protein
MAKCRIQNIKPPCNYSVDGIAKIWLLDWEDFKGYRFEDNGLYSSCLVTDILRVGEFIELHAPDMVAKYSSSGSYLHTLESFVGGLDASTIANLHLGTKRHQLVVFLSNSGKYYTFGYEAGAVLSYQNQTSDGFGSLVNLNAPSKYPLFEVTAEAMVRFICPYKFNPDFENGAYCETT